MKRVMTMAFDVPLRELDSWQRQRFLELLKGYLVVVEARGEDRDKRRLEFWLADDPLHAEDCWGDVGRDPPRPVALTGEQSPHR